MIVPAICKRFAAFFRGKSIKSMEKSEKVREKSGKRALLVSKKYELRVVYALFIG
jgi:hypothetical protein